MNSLHTRYRPQTFDEVLGQDATVRSLKRVVKEKRAHAFLFTGPSGTGKTTLARILGAALHPDGWDVHNLVEFDAASKSGADDIRMVVGSGAYRAIGANPTKFFIIDEAHRLSAAAWSVLLKPLEEPPAHVYYALCTTEVGKIPKAIITRCQRYDLKPVKEELLLELLVKVVDAEKLEVSDEIIEIIADNSGGSPRQALVLLESSLGCKSADEVRQIARTAGQTKELVDLCRWLVGGKGLTWKEATKYLKALDGIEPESCRIVICNYLSSVLLNTTSDRGAANILSILECFKTPYYTPDKMAPLLYSIGMAIKLDGAQ